MSAHSEGSVHIGEEPLWFKDAIIYQVHVRAFLDSNSDGVGDFRGLCEKLDYVRDLGVTAIWLLPFYPSPLRDDGYDIANYTDVHPLYGTLRDFKELLRAAHERGLRVITELVLNHTSDEHPWFQKARRSPPGSPARDFYVWSDTPEKYTDARVIFQDFEQSNWSWDPVAKAYFWHRFYSHQPDLNFDNPKVRKAMFQILDFWLKLGVDGLRLDAVPYLYEREGTSCENLPETHAFLRELRTYVDTHYKDRMLLAEANQWPEDAVTYFGDGDECHMAFHFPLMPRMFMAVQLENRFPIMDILAQTPAIPATCQWALFLRNHDELTLEMVTDEDRDYMVRVYAHEPRARINVGIRRRLAPLLENRRTIELLNSLLFSLPGTPVVYYGDEIGMGDNIFLGDRNGVRTPMQWNSDRNAGFSRAHAQRLYLPVIVDSEYHYEAVNVEAQQGNTHSLLWWMKRIMEVRRRNAALCRGTLRFLEPSNSKILAFVREYGDERVLVVANLSRFVQHVDLDLSRFRGLQPSEVFGGSKFPVIAQGPYPLTVAPHGFYWLSLSGATRRNSEVPPGERVSSLGALKSAAEVFGKGRPKLEEALAVYLPKQRFYRGKGREVREVRIVDVARVPSVNDFVCIAMTRVDYVDAAPELYALPLGVASGENALRIERSSKVPMVARFELTTAAERGPSFSAGAVFDPSAEPEFAQFLVAFIGEKKRLVSDAGEVVGIRTKIFRELSAAGGHDMPVRSLSVEQSNTSIAIGDKFVLKLFRHLDEGQNPDFEIGRFLAETARFDHSPRTAGCVEYHTKRGSYTLGVLHEFVANESDGWSYAKDFLGRFFDRVLTRPDHEHLPADVKAFDVAAPGRALPPLAAETLETLWPMLGVLAARTAQMHLALAQDTTDPEFAPLPFTVHHQRSLLESVRTHMARAMTRLKEAQAGLDGRALADAKTFLASAGQPPPFLRRLVEEKIQATRTRGHGDFHLGQVLFTGKDFVIIDFEGEPSRAIGERRIKRSPLRDVSGMLRSFEYAAAAALRNPRLRVDDVPLLEPWARAWASWCGQLFLNSYVSEPGIAKCLPSEASHTELLLRLYLFDKALYELEYELDHRPDWAFIPLAGLVRLLGSEPA